MGCTPNINATIIPEKSIYNIDFQADDTIGEHVHEYDETFDLTEESEEFEEEASE
jgi:hypothetical protein